MKKRNKVILPLILAIGGILAVFFFSPRFSSSGQQTTSTANMPTAKATRGTIQQTVSELGTLEPQNRIELKADVSGEVVKIFAQAGEKVQKDQPLLQLDTTKLETSLRKAKAQLKSAQADLKKLLAQPKEVELRQAEAQLKEAQIAYQSAKKTLAQNQELFKSGGISQETLEQSEDQVTLKEALYLSAQAQFEDVKDGAAPEDIEKLQAQIEQIEADIESIENDLEKCTFKSPIDGTLLVVDPEEGDSVLSEERVVAIGDLSTMKVKILINEIDVPEVEKGQKAVVTLDAFPNQQFEGKVTTIAPEGKIVENIVVFETTIELPNPDNILLSGMTAEAEIIIKSKDNAIIIPLEALEERGGKAQVLVKGPDGQPVQKEVKTGLRSDTQVEIEEGLQEGEEVFLILSSTSSQSNFGPPMGMPGGR
ncbi:MAG: efflux RND transporter periplasmic adaptor subunit [Atribacterota bacterium]|nr:efflux RND transporter periplasmic adaptor subunit [Atribacterota bacterium]MDI9607330.1 efflux RND transporter periplasmic adaptor subunit [Atribacterota bacterium]HQD33500.1 efflux RND transporter periplasmic adaptor subunit [Candidatus Atribacteria bacterium]